MDNDITDFKVSDQIYMSDRCMITCNILLKQKKNKSFDRVVAYWKIKEDFTNYGSKIINTISKDNINNSIIKITGKIRSITKKYSKHYIRNCENAPWWNGQLKVQSSKLRAFRRRYQKENDQEERQKLMLEFKKTESSI